MTPFKRALAEIAEHGPPLGDAAERAITYARRRRRVLVLAPPALAVVLVAMAALVMSGFSPRERDLEPAMRFHGTETITFPTRAPQPLPAQGVAGAKLAYTVMCLGTGTRRQHCVQWRIITTDGRHYRIPDAIQEENRDGMLEHDGALALSPDGRSIAYFDEAGRFLIRELSSGRTRSPFTVWRSDLTRVASHIAWSPDRRRLTVSFEPVDDDDTAKLAARLVDLATMTTTTLPHACCVLGLGADDTPAPMYDAYAASMGHGEILWVGGDGAVQRRLPIGDVERSSVFPRHPGNTPLSADGRRLAALLCPQDTAGRHRGPDRRPEEDLSPCRRAGKQTASTGAGADPRIGPHKEQEEGRMPTRRAETSQESRRRLIEAAATAFAEKGYRQTSIAEVADLAGISRGSIPWHFGSKEGLLLAVVEHAFAVAAGSFSDDHPAGPDGLAALVDQTEAFVRLPVTKLLVSLLLEAMEPDSPIHRQYVELHSAMRRGYADWAARPHADLRLPDGMTPDDVATLILGATIGLHQQWRLAPDRIDLHRAYGNLRKIVLGALAPR